MIEVIVFAHLSNGYVVLFGGDKYILNDWDILFDNSKTYTLPNKLTQRYHESR